MDVGLKHFRSPALQEQRKVLAIGFPQRMAQPIRLDGVKTFEEQQRFDQARARRITIEHRHDVGLESFGDRRILCDDFRIGLTQNVARHLLALEPFADALDDRARQRVVIEDVGKHQVGEFR